MHLKSPFCTVLYKEFAFERVSPSDDLVKEEFLLLLKKVASAEVRYR
jgi:hypothetical protein